MTQEALTRAWVSDVVRSGLWDDAETREQVIDALRVDHPSLPAEATADRWIADANRDWAAAARDWPEVTDHDRLENAFVTLEASGVPVLRGCPDHWAARDLLRGAPADVRGVAWFTPPDVWHAIDEGMLEVNLWHASTANVAPGDRLLDDAIAAFDAAGLEAVFDEGRVEVVASWQRRPA